MSEVGNGEVVARLEKIERENRFLKGCIVTLVIFAVGACVMQQTPSVPRTIEAERLVIRRPNGKEAISLEAANDSTSAYFYNPNGSKGVWISTASGGNTVHVLSPKKELEIAMNASTHIRYSQLGQPGGESESADFYILRVSPDDKDDKGFKILHPILDLGPDVLRLFDKEGKALWSAP